MNAQKGAVLIYVLFVLLAMTLLAATAVQKSSSDLGVVTSAQVGDLAFQASELALSKIELDSSEGDNSLLRSNIRGYVYADGMDNREVIFCLKPQTGRLFTSSLVSERLKGTSSDFVNGLNNGFCDPSQPSDYVNQRKTSMTQVYAEQVKGAGCANRPFCKEANGSYTLDLIIPGTGKAQYEINFMDIDSITLIPSFAQDSSAVSNCLKNKAKEDTQDCLDAAGVPNERHYQRYQSYSVGFPSVQWGGGS